MADGFRILENGDIRFTESSDTRITENFIEAFSSLAAVGSKVSSGISTVFGATNFTGAGTVASIGYLSTTASASLSGAGSSLNVGYQTFPTAASLVASSLITSLGDVKLIVFANLQSDTTLANTSLRRRYGVSSLSTVGSQIAAAEKTLFGRFTTGAVEYTRILENGDNRITEAGDTRITINTFGNTGEGTLVNTPVHTVFTSQPYYKQLGTWTTFIPYVKYGGVWKDNVRIYKNQNGTWKRSY